MRRLQKRDSQVLVATTAGLGVVPAALAFLNVYPDWTLQYLIPKEALPPWFEAAFCFLIIVSALLGHWLQGMWSKTLWVFTAVYGVYNLWSLARIGIVTSYADYHAGNHPEFPMAFLETFAIFGSLAAAVFVGCLRYAVTPSLSNVAKPGE